ncbi:MAG: hypothetical protein ACJA0Q_001720, partial [Saprospiraceae bacterium]
GQELTLLFVPLFLFFFGIHLFVVCSSYFIFSNSLVRRASSILLGS